VEQTAFIVLFRSSRTAGRSTAQIVGKVVM
jgi:hypothetical protein